MGQPPSLPLRLLSSAPLLTVLLVGAMAARQLWACFFRRPKFGRWTWCISYHAASLAREPTRSGCDRLGRGLTRRRRLGTLVEAPELGGVAQGGLRRGVHPGSP